MPKYRKKPVVIEARQFNPDTDWEGAMLVQEWCGAKIVVCSDIESTQIIIHTLEGDHLAGRGDWIIRGIQGEFYPCKHDIFEVTYEEVVLWPASF